MSNLIIDTADMHKVACVSVEIKFMHPGNVVAYISTNFEIFSSRKKFFACPLASDEDRRLVNLPKVFSFAYQDEQVNVSKPHLKDVASEIVNKLGRLGIINTCRKSLITIALPYKYSPVV